MLNKFSTRPTFIVSVPSVRLLPVSAVAVGVVNTDPEQAGAQRIHGDELLDLCAEKKADVKLACAGCALRCMVVARTLLDIAFAWFSSSAAFFIASRVVGLGVQATPAPASVCPS